MFFVMSSSNQISGVVLFLVENDWRIFFSLLLFFEWSWSKKKKIIKKMKKNQKLKKIIKKIQKLKKKEKRKMKK